MSINDKQLTEDHILIIALQITEAMLHLGSKNIIHRDLSAKNILVFK